MKKNYFKLFPIVLLLLALPVGVYVVTRNFSIGDVRNRASGEDVFVTIDPDAENHSIDMLGVNIAAKAISGTIDPYLDQTNATRIELINQMKALNFRFTRYPTGCHIASFDWAHDDVATEALDAMLDISDEIGADMIFEMSVMGLVDPQGNQTFINPCGNTVEVRFPIGDLADPSNFGIKNFVHEYSVERKAQGKPYIKYYELGNEDWGYHDTATNPNLTPQEYIDAAEQVSDAIHEVVSADPELAQEVKIIGVSNLVPSSGYTGVAIPYGDSPLLVWGAQEYADNASPFDFITYHPYWHDMWIGGESASPGDSLFSLDFFLKPNFELYQSMMADTPKFQVPAVTEWNLYCWIEPTAHNRQRNTSRFEHTLYTLGHSLVQFDNNVQISTYLMTQIPVDTYDMQYQVDPVRQGCNLFYKQSDSPFTIGLTAPGLAVQILNQHFGTTHVKTAIDSPLVTYDDQGDFPAITGGSSKSADGSKIYTILINKKVMVGSDETSPENNLTTSITIDGHSGSVRYTLYRLTAPSFSSELKDIELTAEEPKTVDNGFPISVRNQSALILEMTLAPGGVGPAPEPACTPDCTGKECGSDGCEGTCGTCLSTETCSASQICVPVETSCTPACSGKECGSDGCGGSCGTCSSTETCNSSHICALLPTPAGTTGSSGSTGTSGSSGTSGTTGASGTSGTGSTTGTTDVLVPPSELDLPTYTGSTADDTSEELPDNNEAPSGITGTDMQTLPDTGILTNHPLLTFGIFCSLASLLLWLSIPSFQTHVLQKTTRKEEQRARTLREKHTQQQYFEQQVLRKVPQENTSKRQ